MPTLHPRRPIRSKGKDNKADTRNSTIIARKFLKPLEDHNLLNPEGLSLEADDAFDEATGAANLAPLRAGEAIMFERKEAFHVKRLKPPMDTRKMVEARGRGPLSPPASNSTIAPRRRRRGRRDHFPRAATGRTSGR